LDKFLLVIAAASKTKY